jgi:hypothetical protein
LSQVAAASMFGNILFKYIAGVVRDAGEILVEKIEKWQKNLIK